MATAAEVADLDIEELETRLTETRREVFNLRFQLATGQLDDVSRLKYAKKDIARLLTELRSREIAEAEGLAVEELPAHRAAVRQRAEDAAAGRTRESSDERRAKRRAAAAEAEAESGHDHEAEADAADEAELLAEDEVEAEVLEAELAAEAEAADTDDSATGSDDAGAVEEKG